VEGNGFCAFRPTPYVEITEQLPPRESWSKTIVFFHTEVAMPIQLFTEAERVQRNHFPEVIAYEDLVIPTASFNPLSCHSCARGCYHLSILAHL
jgi:hypothetical protein